MNNELSNTNLIENSIKSKIYTIRGVQVLLDSDLAEIYVSANSRGIAKLEVRKFHLKLERANHLLEVVFFDLKFGLWKKRREK